MQTESLCELIHIRTKGEWRRESSLSPPVVLLLTVSKAVLLLWIFLVLCLFLPL